MFLSDLKQEVFLSLTSNKSRSALTILGIVIGIASVIAMISIGQGATKDIESNIQSLGSNLLIIMPGSQKSIGSIVRGGMGSASTLTIDDARAIGEMRNIEKAAPVVSTARQVSYKRENTSTHIFGVDISYFEMRNLEMEFGGFFSLQQEKRMSKVAILGSATRDNLFGENINPIGEKIRIGNTEFTVIGVTISKGGTGAGNSDDLVYIPISLAQKYFLGNDSVNSIYTQVSSDDLMSLAQEEITSLLLFRHKIKNPEQADFFIMNQADILEAMSLVMGTLTLLLGSIAGISLLVGGIGIMNMMLTTVSERIKEIGLRKSLGAKKRDIHLQFLAEAIALTFIGGIVGVIFGSLISLLISHFSGMTTTVSLSAVVLAFVVSAGIGIIFGYYPAKKAAKLNPIEALRYE